MTKHSQVHTQLQGDAASSDEATIILQAEAREFAPQEVKVKTVEQRRAAKDLRKRKERSAERRREERAEERARERAREGKAKMVEATRASSKESRRGQAQREMVIRRQSTRSEDRGEGPRG
jgi:hypothetical protein